MIEMRPARMSDADILFEWANDPGTRAWSKSTAAIPREDHDRWMQFNVQQGYPSHLVMIAEGHIGRVGAVRFDADPTDVMRYRVGIVIAPKYRDRGFGAHALSQACHLMPDVRIDAEIKHNNWRSRKIFEHCGFKLVEDGDLYLTYRREPTS